MKLIFVLAFSLLLPISTVVERASAAEEVILAHNFDDGTTQGWGPRGSVTVESVTDTARSGTNSLKTIGSTATWNGPSLNVTKTLEQGATYLISGYARLVDGTASSNLKFTVQRQPQSGDTAYDQVNTPVAITDADWVKLEGEYVFDSAVSELQLYVESDDAASKFYLDDITITLTAAAPAEPDSDAGDVAAEHSFEDSQLNGWGPRGDVVVAISDEEAKTGAYSLKTTNRSANWNGPSLDASMIMVKGAQYEIKASLKLVEAPETPSTVKISMESKPVGGETGWGTIAESVVSTMDWVELSGTYTFGTDMEAMSLYVESSNANDEFYIDDFSIVLVSTPGVQLDIPSLYEQYSDAFEIGAAINANQTDGDYGVLIKKHYNSVVAENAMEPGPIQPTEGNFNWTEVDQIVKFAKENGQTIRFHTLVWHSQAAEWMFLDKDGNPMEPTAANKELLLDRLETHIREVAGRYKDDIRDWDVVNEVIDPSQPDGLRRSTWFEITGTEYIELAFRVTDEVAGADANLYINDYSTHDPKKRDFLYDLVKGMLDKGVPIDGIGHQTHINIASPSITLMRESIEKFASLGLDNQITELDISIYTNDTDTYAEVPEEILIEQAHRYKEVFDMFVELKDDISSVILWGTDDSRTWLLTFPITRINLPLLFDKNLQVKHSYWALVDITKVPEAPEKEVIVKQLTQAYKGKPKIDGEMDAIWSKTSEIATDIWVSGTEGAKANVSTMWDDGYLYVYAHVIDDKLSKASANVWEQDSFEIFVDQNYAQTDSYESDDGQFRVNYMNEASFGGMASDDNFTSVTKKVKDGYIVEAAIKLNPEWIKSGAKIGYDVQVNNDQDGNGTRDSVSIWSDPTGFSFQSTLNFGTLELVKGNVKGDVNNDAKKHMVKAGDHLTKIAELYGTTWRALQELNQLKNPNLIYPGQEILLP